jgi:hypothetical protein
MDDFRRLAPPMPGVVARAFRGFRRLLRLAVADERQLERRQQVLALGALAGAPLRAGRLTRSGTKVTIYRHPDETRPMTDDDFADAFALGNIAPADFDHRAHLRAAFCLVRRRPFLDACVAMRDGLHDLARRAGRPGLYHETITVAFMSIVAQRAASRADAAWDDFVAAHPDLMDRALLERWYRRETLQCALARAQFVMPDAEAA